VLLDGEELVLRHARRLDVAERLERALLVGEHFARERLEVAAAPAHLELEHVAQPLDPCEVERAGAQLLGRERLHHVVLRALAEQPRAERVVRPRGEDQDRDAVEVGLLANRGDHPLTAHARQRDLRDDEVHARLGRFLEAGPPIPRRHHGERVAEGFGDDAARALVVRDDQHAGARVDGEAGRSVLRECGDGSGLRMRHAETVTTLPQPDRDASV
jgi:hypothetical protein